MIKNLEVNSESKVRISKTFISKIVNKLKNDLHFEISSLIINFVSAAKITEINIAHLNHNYSTDIITFGYSETNSIIDAEIFISTEVALANAVKYKVSFNEEIIRLIIHGILHLTGYDDKTQKTRFKMKRLENQLLKSYMDVLFTKKTLA